MNMEAMEAFINRNKDSYEKVSHVSSEIIQKYKDILPDDLIYIWENMGLGIYENGFLQLINPEDYEFVFQYVDKLLHPTIVIGITALGDLLVWEGNEGRTIAENEGKRCKLINVRKCTDNVISGFLGTFNVFMQHFLEEKDYFDAKPYLEIKDKLPKLEYGQCYGYVPALALGGSKSTKNLKIVDAKSYINTIGQAVGKIVDLS
ncbi:MAG: T6SS immunity protein Tdi1 domain-containing protein [Fluviicola sp.]